MRCDGVAGAGGSGNATVTLTGIRTKWTRAPHDEG
jgi:hypothetical protein